MLSPRSVLSSKYTLLYLSTVVAALPYSNYRQRYQRDIGGGDIGFPFTTYVIRTVEQTTHCDAVPRKSGGDI